MSTYKFPKTRGALFKFINAAGDVYHLPDWFYDPGGLYYGLHKEGIKALADAYNKISTFQVTRVGYTLYSDLYWPR